jgi:hypothetical protein
MIHDELLKLEVLMVKEGDGRYFEGKGEEERFLEWP